jgi:hypothetical protein
METILTNWQTTLAGIVGGIVTYTVTMIQSGNIWDWKAWALGIVPVILGFLSKDQTTTGTGISATK